MKIALINENSQAAKNELIFNTLKSVVEPMGHEVFNYGMYSADDEAQLTYVQNGILAAILLLQAVVQAKVQCLLVMLSQVFYVVMLLTHLMVICLLRLMMVTVQLSHLLRALAGVLN